MEKNYVDRDYPEKSWSISKMKTLDNCTREYYYTYYGSHNGWKWESGDEPKLAWRLKKLTNLWLAFGEVIHKQIRGIMNSCKGHIPKFMEEEKFKEIALKTLRGIVRESIEKSKTNEWNDYPKGVMLQEYYYENPISKETGIELTDRVEKCTSNFYICKSFQEILNNNVIIIENDEDVFSSFLYDNLKVYSKLDLLYIDENGNYIIVDWKTGKKSEDDKKQLLIYAWYVNIQYKVPLDKIKGRIEYLYLGENEEVDFYQDDIINMEGRIARDLKIINYYLDDEILNKPKDKEEFYKTEITGKCKNCKYRLLCQQDCHQ